VKDDFWGSHFGSGSFITLAGVDGAVLVVGRYTIWTVGSLAKGMQDNKAAVQKLEGKAHLLREIKAQGTLKHKQRDLDFVLVSCLAGPWIPCIVLRV
jgi:hypothetical protein